MGSGNTRVELLLAAERLFGERGIHAVSLREVNLAAGQRNTSASHYHFGSKEALISAIVAYRRVEIIDRRLVMFDLLEARGQASSARAIVNAYARPLIELARQDDSHGEYVCFLAQLFNHPSSNWRGLLLTPDDHDFARFTGLLAPLLVSVPADLVLPRIFQVTRHIVIALAFRRRAAREATGTLVDSDAVFYEDLIDGSTAYLTAEPSDEVRAALSEKISN